MGQKTLIAQKNYYELTMMDDEKFHSSVRPKNVWNYIYFYLLHILSANF